LLALSLSLARSLSRRINLLTSQIELFLGSQTVRYNQGLKVDFETIGQVSTAANAVKAFFRELKEPLVPTAAYQAIIRMQEETKDNDTKIGKTRALLEAHAHPANLNTLRALVYFIADVGDKSETNGMSTSNLALVWGPNLIWGKGAGPTSERIPQLAHIKVRCCQCYATALRSACMPGFVTACSVVDANVCQCHTQTFENVAHALIIASNLLHLLVFQSCLRLYRIFWSL
jgi:hypothetical protein